MSKLATILQLIQLLGPYLKDLMPIIKQIIEVIKGFKEDKPLVGATAPTQTDVEIGIAQLLNAGVPEQEARDMLAI